MNTKKYKLYCPKCGARCRVTADFEEFDKKNGKPLYSYWASCPKGKPRWYDFILGNEHTHNEFVNTEVRSVQNY